VSDLREAELDDLRAEVEELRERMSHLSASLIERDADALVELAPGSWVRPSDVVFVLADDRVVRVRLARADDGIAWEAPSREAAVAQAEAAARRVNGC
jgi:hypothetical protein